MKVKVSTPNNTPYSEDEIMIITWNFRKLFRKSGKTLRSQVVYKSNNQYKRNVNKQQTEKHVETKSYELHRKTKEFNVDNVRFLATHKLSVLTH